MNWIDADAHVVESLQTWDYLDPSEEKFRPVLVSDGKTQYWMIEGKIRGVCPKSYTIEQFAELSRTKGRKMDQLQEARTLENVDARVRHLDQSGIEIQVLYPSIFLDECTDRAEVDVALCGAYNRWLADIWKQGKGRLRWMCALPLLSIPDAVDQLRFSKDNGACGIFMRPIEGQRRPTDPYFFPIYEEASRLDLCIGFHQSNGNASLVDFFRAPVDFLGESGRRDFFNQYRMFNVGLFFSLISTGLPLRFPKLRAGFIETAASWIPWVLMELRGRMETINKRLPDNLVQQYRLYVTCQTGDDVAYLLKFAGDNLMIGTDYGHADSSTEIDASRTLAERGEISQEAFKKIINNNPREFYGLSS